MGSRARIMLIDDDRDMHAVVRAILEPSGYDVSCCATGAEGLARMNGAPLAVLLLDIMLTEPLEGLHIACRMRQDERLKAVPIIFVSAVGEAFSLEYAREMCPVTLAPDAFLEKPLQASGLRDAVRTALDRAGR